MGDFPIDLAEVYGPAVAAKRFAKGALKAWFPSNSILITTPEAKVLVDPGDSAKLSASMDPRPDPRRFRPVPLVSQLAEVGVAPSEVTHVVVTHLHFDHFAGVTAGKGGRWAAVYPKARHIIPKRDWDMPDIAEGRKKGDKDIEGTLEVIEKAGLVDLVDGRVQVAHGLAVEPYPGESPGHQVLALSAGGSRVYCIGDLFHIVQEVEHPGLAAVWTDRKTLAASQRRFASTASNEGALVLSGHMQPGFISLSRGRRSWRPAEGQPGTSI